MDRVFRSGTKSRGISDVYPALKRVFPRITGFQEFKDSIKNIQSLMKVCEVIKSLVVVVVVAAAAAAAATSWIRKFHTETR